MPDTKTHNTAMSAAGTAGSLKNRPWTDEEDAVISRGLNAGVTAREIARQLKGRTRNAVIGRSKRMRDAGNSLTSVTTLEKNRPPRQPGTDVALRSDVLGSDDKRRGFGVVLSVKNAARMMRIEDLPRNGACRWPIDVEDGSVRFCGDAPRDGYSYCAEHAERSISGRSAVKPAHRAPQADRKISR